MRRPITTITAAIAALGTMVLPAPVGALHTEAAAPARLPSVTRYTLSWNWNALDDFLHKNDEARIVWSVSPRTAPAPSATARRADPCSVIEKRSSYGALQLFAVAERVTNGRMSQECPVTLRATQNRSFTGSPASITKSYEVLSNEPIQNPPGAWCVTSCRYVNGAFGELRDKTIFRFRGGDGQCFVSHWSAKLTYQPGGMTSVVMCPIRVQIEAPSSMRLNTQFSVRAWNNLQEDVYLRTSTPSICTVRATGTEMNHTVIGLRSGTCRLYTDVPSDGSFIKPAAVWDSVTITNPCPTCAPPPTTTPPPSTSPTTTSAIEGPAPVPGVALTARTWMRLGATEALSLRSAFTCDFAGSDPTVACGTSPEATTASSGSYVEIMNVANPQATLTPPAGYPTSRYRVVSPFPATATSFAEVVVKMRFDQATAAGTSFSITITATVTWREVDWVRTGSDVTRTPGAPQTSYLSATHTFGVVGATR